LGIGFRVRGEEEKQNVYETPFGKRRVKRGAIKTIAEPYISQNEGGGG